MSEANPTSILFCITVYNGEEFIRRTLESATRLSHPGVQVDLLVLDDASPAPGFSERLEEMCAELNVGYYRTPRNLGIPRNVSLGMLTALREGYDHVVISNSDVIYPANLIGQLLACAEEEGVGSVTAWSNNVSVYSLPNDDPDEHLAAQARVDWVSGLLADHYGAAVMDIPAGISFCILVPTRVVADVGVMDPVFGRGYCEETDWSLRSLAAGYRIALAPGTFVYHQGRGSNLAAGLVAEGQTTVPANEAIIDMRYPLFRTQVDAFVNSGILDKAHRDAAERIVQYSGRALGYRVDIGWLPPRSGGEQLVAVSVAPDGADEIRAEFMGFRVDLPLEGPDVVASLTEFFGREPDTINVRDSGKTAAGLPETMQDRTQRIGNYPARV
ncbi:glycosyltransferase family 2 protein [Nocardioides seonyuensis]|uniref:Glycosyltransferase family 2 protein n=1 Tax=Nocardioides seonyuensis TaxID=2518371 RepID=A0A4P7IHH3_9ACTN|nr:glycosyltransferase family 2 protein [Nocardioides seonyuensis]QBX55617.1 glycosyltransferase family 2 protein [Nocardioides seonyuensis]